jgi:hypothetical protein
MSSVRKYVLAAAAAAVAAAAHQHIDSRSGIPRNMESPTELVVKASTGCVLRLPGIIR